MGCCGQNTTGAGAAAIDTGKRVNYTQGMLLGVDDFVQDQAYEIARRHELAREVLGYGTVRGLQVLVEDDGGKPRVRVTPGMAWLPSGTAVCVPSDQCCSIDEWLIKHEADYAGQVSGSSATLTLYAVLAYAACPTDKVPIPGEPCRDESELMQDSRIADCFRLELRLAPPAKGPAPPAQVEEDAVRDFADWLAKIPVDPSSPPLSDEAFLDQLRAAAHDWLQPSSPHPRDFMFGSPSVGLGTSDALMRAALRLWVTELRPLWRARYGCGPTPLAEGGSDDAVLLAALGLKLTKGGHWEAQSDVEIIEDERPVLLSLRLVQELITQNPAPEPGHTVVPATTFGQPSTPGHDTAYSRADHSHGTPALPLLAGDAAGPIAANQVVGILGKAISSNPLGANNVLAYDGTSQWVPTVMPLPAASNPSTLTIGQLPKVGSSAEFARADHEHGVNALPALAGDVSGALDETVVQGIQGITVYTSKMQGGEVLMYQEAEGFRTGPGWVPTVLTMPAPGSELPAELTYGGKSQAGKSAGYALADHSHGLPMVSFTGDLSSSSGTERIASLQKVPVKAEKPAKGQVLTFDGSAWVPQAVAAPSSSPLVEVVCAGTVVVTLTTEPLSVKAVVTSKSGPVTATPSGAKGAVMGIELMASGIPDLKGPKSEISVRFTPLFFNGVPIGLSLFAAGVDDKGITVDLAMWAGGAFSAGQYGFQFEISRYAPYQGADT